MHNHSNGNELRILMQIKLISLTIVEHQDSLRNRDKQQLGNGPLKGKNEIVSSSVDVFPKTSNLAISRCCFADEIDKNENARAECAEVFLLLTKYANL